MIASTIGGAYYGLAGLALLVGVVVLNRASTVFTVREEVTGYEDQVDPQESPYDWQVDGV